MSNISNTEITSTGHIIEYKFGDIVFLKTDLDQKERIVTGISLRPNGYIQYALGCGTTETWHNKIEISIEKRIF